MVIPWRKLGEVARHGTYELISAYVNAAVRDPEDVVNHAAAFYILRCTWGLKTSRLNRDLFQAAAFSQTETIGKADERNAQMYGRDAGNYRRRGGGVLGGGGTTGGGGEDYRADDVDNAAAGVDGLLGDGDGDGVEGFVGNALVLDQLEASADVVGYWMNVFGLRTDGVQRNMPAEEQALVDAFTAMNTNMFLRGGVAAAAAIDPSTGPLVEPINVLAERLGRADEARGRMRMGQAPPGTAADIRAQFRLAFGELKSGLGTDLRARIGRKMHRETYDGALLEGVNPAMGIFVAPPGETAVFGDSLDKAKNLTRTQILGTRVAPARAREEGGGDGGEGNGDGGQGADGEGAAAENADGGAPQLSVEQELVREMIIGAIEMRDNGMLAATQETGGTRRPMLIEEEMEPNNLFWLNGPGGSGKTFTVRSIVTALRAYVEESKDRMASMATISESATAEGVEGSAARLGMRYRYRNRGGNLPEGTAAAAAEGGGGEQPQQQQGDEEADARAAAENAARDGHHQPLIMCALQGNAASNLGMGATTAHRAFSIQVASEEQLEPADGLPRVPYLDICCPVEDLRLIVIEEVSMVPANMLSRIHRKLQRRMRLAADDWDAYVSVHGTDLRRRGHHVGNPYRRRAAMPFGGVIVLGLGDFYQLPPASGKLLASAALMPQMQRNAGGGLVSTASVLQTTAMASQAQLRQASTLDGGAVWRHARRFDLTVMRRAGGCRVLLYILQRMRETGQFTPDLLDLIPVLKPDMVNNVDDARWAGKAYSLHATNANRAEANVFHVRREATQRTERAMEEFYWRHGSVGLTPAERFEKEQTAEGKVEMQELAARRAQILSGIVNDDELPTPTFAYDFTFKFLSQAVEGLAQPMRDFLHEFFAETRQLFLRGAPVMLLQNVNVSLGLTNGAMGKAHALYFEPDHAMAIRLAELCALVDDTLLAQLRHGCSPAFMEVRFPLPHDIPAEKMKAHLSALYGGLDHGDLAAGQLRVVCLEEDAHAPHLVVPFSPSRVVDAKLRVPPQRANEFGKTLKAFYKGFPVAPAAAMTCHKSQGLTLFPIILDLARPLGYTGPPLISFESLYVAISRATSIRDLAILPFDDSTHHVGALTRLSVSAETRKYLDIERWNPETRLRDFSDVETAAAGAARGGAGAGAGGAGGSGRRRGRTNHAAILRGELPLGDQTAAARSAAARGGGGAGRGATATATVLDEAGDRPPRRRTRTEPEPEPSPPPPPQQPAPVEEPARVEEVVPRVRGRGGVPRLRGFRGRLPPR